MANKKELKVVRVVELDEIIEVDGGFFRIEKQKMDDSINRSYDRYFLKKIKSPKEMKDFAKYLMKHDAVVLEMNNERN